MIKMVLTGLEGYECYLKALELCLGQLVQAKKPLNFNCFPIQLNPNSISSGQVYHLPPASQAL